MFPSRVWIIRVAAFAHECGPFHSGSARSWRRGTVSTIATHTRRGRVGAPRTGRARRIASPTRRQRRRPAGISGEASSSNRRAGGVGRGSRPRRALRAIAASRGISAGRARASTTCQAGIRTRSRASTRRRGSGGSAPRRRPGRRGGGGRSGDRGRAVIRGTRIDCCFANSLAAQESLMRSFRFRNPLSCGIVEPSLEPTQQSAKWAF